jgi:hypothetical protein
MRMLIKRLAGCRKRLRHLASVILFVIYVTIGTAHLLEVNNPRVMGGLHIAAGVAHLL